MIEKILIFFIAASLSMSIDVAHAEAARKIPRI
jgi:hypothetical protein